MQSNEQYKIIFIFVNLIIYKNLILFLLEEAIINFLPLKKYYHN